MIIFRPRSSTLCLFLKRACGQYMSLSFFLISHFIGEISVTVERSLWRTNVLILYPSNIKIYERFIYLKFNFVLIILTKTILNENQVLWLNRFYEKLLRNGATHKHTRTWATHLLDHRRHKERKREERTAEPWGRLLVKVNDLMKAKHEKRDRARERCVCMPLCERVCVRPILQGLRTRIGPKPWLSSTIREFVSRLPLPSFRSPSPNIRSGNHLPRGSKRTVGLADVRNRMRVYRAARAGHRDHGKCGHGQGPGIWTYRGKFSASTWSHFRWSLISGERRGLIFCWRAISIILMKANETALLRLAKRLNLDVSFRSLCNTIHTAKDVGLC